MSACGAEEGHERDAVTGGMEDTA